MEFSEIAPLPPPAPPPTPAREAPGNQSWKSNFLAITSKPDSAIISGDLKLHYWWETGDVQLYNLVDDLAETTDLAKSYPEKAAELKKQIFTYLKEINAQLPTVNEAYDPATDPALRKKSMKSKKAPK